MYWLILTEKTSSYSLQKPLTSKFTRCRNRLFLVTKVTPLPVFEITCYKFHSLQKILTFQQHSSHKIKPNGMKNDTKQSIFWKTLILTRFHSKFTWSVLLLFSLILLAPCTSESWIKIKINLNFYFHTSLWCLGASKGFMKSLKAFISVKRKI